MNETIANVKEMNTEVIKSLGIGLLGGIIFAMAVYLFFNFDLIILTPFIAGLITGLIFPADEEDGIYTSALVGGVLMGFIGLLTIIYLTIILTDTSVTYRILFLIIGGLIGAVAGGTVGGVLGLVGGVIGRPIGLLTHVLKLKFNGN